MEALAAAREAQETRLNKLAPPPVVVEPEREAARETEGQGEAEAERDWADRTPPPVRSMVAEIIDSVIHESSGTVTHYYVHARPPPRQAERDGDGETDSAIDCPSVFGSIEDTVSDAAARVRRQGGNWHPQIDAFWVDGAARQGEAEAVTASSTEAERDRESGPIRVGEGSRVWRA